ncbi:MAG TPA: hypothetical protein VFA55_07335, partial [Candidatus Kapabacteria bacterium]|nr:hypothetical protein [Candidatus Kapabacteria bacterium]
GAAHTMLTVITENTPHQASHDDISARYSFTKERQPSIIATWNIGKAFTIEEEFFASWRQTVIIRRVRVKNNTPENRRVKVQAAFYPNFILFDTLKTNLKDMVIEGNGFLKTQIYAQQDANIDQRWITVDLGSFGPTETKTMEFVYLAGDTKQDIFSTNAQSLIDDDKDEWTKLSHFECDVPGYNNLLESSLLGLRSVVANEGKMDAGLWQYNAEWVQDSSAALMACVYSGRFDMARALMKRIMETMVNESGSPMEASRFVADDMMELNQSGQLLYALWVYWVWTGDDAFDNHWDKVKAVANNILKQNFVDSASGLLHNKREFWERTESMGVQDGFELSHQVLCMIGLEKLAAYAAKDHKDDAAKWGDAAKKMKDALINNPKYSLVADGHFVKRKTMTGDVVKTITPPDKNALPAGVPLATEDQNFIDPDAADVLPIIYDVVESNSALATGTLAFVEKLWNERWDTGGYGRYDVTSEPDSPGAWTFPTVFIARAYAAVGDSEKVKRVLDWLGSVQGGKGGGWFEFYGSRPVPPLPPVGIVAYAWSEIVALFVRDMIGLRPTADSLVIRPKLLAGIKSYSGTVRFRDTRITLTVTSGAPSAKLNGAPVQMQNGEATIPLPLKDNPVIEISV